MAPVIDVPLYNVPAELPDGAPDVLPDDALISAAVFGHFDGVKAATIGEYLRKARAARKALGPGESPSPRWVPEPARTLGVAHFWSMAQYRARAAAR